MLFSDWYTSEKQNEVAAHSSDLIAEWFHRFNNFEMLYEESTFWELFYVELLNSKMEIAKITALVAQLKAGDKPEFNEFNLGTTSKTTIANTTTNKTTSTGSDSQNYQGYNVEGTFSKNSSEATTDNNGSVNSTSSNDTVNLLEEIFKSGSLDLANLFNNLYKKFIKLFVTLY